MPQRKEKEIKEKEKEKEKEKRTPLLPRTRMSAHAREKIFKKKFRKKDRALSTRKKRKEKVAPKRKEQKENPTMLVEFPVSFSWLHANDQTKLRQKEKGKKKTCKEFSLAGP